MTNFIPVNEPVIGLREKQLVKECLDTGWISSEGPFVSQFEDAFSTRVERTYGVACSNGSAALDIAIAALGIGPGDEVIMPTFTIISCAASIVRAGAKPVLVDADQGTWNMDPECVASAITTKTAAIMVVHIYGLPVEMDPILRLAEEHSIPIIEDAAELIGGSYKNKPCGSFGKISTFSFYPNKHITTGEGGMVVTDDKVLAERCRSLRNLCFQANKRFIHEDLGWNYRMTNLQAALGLGQLERLDESLQRKREIGLRYQEAFQSYSALQLPIPVTEYAENYFWVYGLIWRKSNNSASDIMKRLSAVGIGTRPFFYPIHKQPVFQKLGMFNSTKAPISENLAAQGFYIPSGLAISNEQIDRVIHEVITIVNE